MGLFSDFLQKGNAFQPGGTGSITSSLVENTNNPVSYTHLRAHET